jgi:hypothetical protein
MVRASRQRQAGKGNTRRGAPKFIGLSLHHAWANRTSRMNNGSPILQWIMSEVASFLISLLSPQIQSYSSLFGEDR